MNLRITLEVNIEDGSVYLISPNNPTIERLVQEIWHAGVAVTRDKSNDDKK